ncbi:MAG: 2-oxo acid dehydrogenase subunit E2 [Bacteroidota bacterium]
MKDPYRLKIIPESRIATFDTFAAGMQKHHVAALLEFDVTEIRRRLQELRRQGTEVSFNGWLVATIAATLKQHPEAAAFLRGRKKLLLFDEVRVAFLVEKEFGGEKVPLPLVIHDAGRKSAVAITREIAEALEREPGPGEKVLQRQTTFGERLYYHLPGFLRRAVWNYLLRHPRAAYGKMGNVAITSVGMMGRINGWFIHRSVHPLSFGIGSVLRKPAVVGSEIRIREILNMTVLIDHDVIDGAPMVRFLNELTKAVESGKYEV